MSAESLGLSVPDETEMDRRAEAIADHIITTLGAHGVARRTPRAMLIAGARLALHREQRTLDERREIIDALDALASFVECGGSEYAKAAAPARALLNRIREREGK